MVENRLQDSDCICKYYELDIFQTEEKQRIIEFYTSDEYSRQLPGMKNVKSVKQSNGKRQKIQKRLLLINIKELYAEYKKKFSCDGVRLCKLSVFFENRPAYVMSVLAEHILYAYVYIIRT